MESFLAGTRQNELAIRTRDEREIAFAGLSLTRFRFNVKDYRGRETWVAALYGKPEGAGPFPGIVHIHGGGQTVSSEDVAWCVARGFAAVSFDWTGPSEDRDFVTEWAEDVGSCWTMGPPPQANRIYHAVIAARRAVTFLAARREVDAERIGAYGISWGGFATWLVNGCDERLKAAVAVYGCGGVLNPGHTMSRETAGELTDFQRALYQRCFGPETYAPTQNAPVLFLDGTNDFFGWPRAAADIARLVNVDLRMHFSANFNHHVEPPGAAAAEAFLRMRLAGGPAMPRNPTSELAREGEKLVAVIRPDRPEDVEKVVVCYSISPVLDPDKCWRFFEAERAGDEWRSAIRDAPLALEVALTGEVHYRSGFALSPVPVVVPAGVGAAPEPRDVLWAPGEGLWGWCDGGSCGAGTQLYQRNAWCELERDESGAERCIVSRLAPGLRALDAGLRRPADPAYRADESVRGLELVFEAPGARELKLIARKRYYHGEGEEFAFLLPAAGGGVQTVRVAAEDMVRPDGTALEDFADVRFLRLAGTLPEGGRARFYSLKWIRRRTNRIVDAGFPPGF